MCKYVNIYCRALGTSRACQSHL